MTIHRPSFFFGVTGVNALVGITVMASCPACEHRGETSTRPSPAVVEVASSGLPAPQPMSKEGLQRAQDAARRAQEARPLERTGSPIVGPSDFAPRDEEKKPLAQMWNRLGEQKLAAKKIDKAIEMFERAVELDPNLDAARENLAAARRAQQRPGAKPASGGQVE